MKQYLTLFKHSLMIGALVLLTNLANAQTIVVKGQVVDPYNSSLPGVNILVKGDGSGTITDLDGNYKIEVSPSATLVFSFMGHVTQEILVQGRTTINVELEEDVKALEEVLVIGYGTQRKKEITGAVQSVKAETILKTPTSDLGESLQGQIAGVNVQASSGRPGAATNVQIRGILSATNAGGPLYIVDGIPFQSNPNIAPEQIESIEVLKDGAAASIYGTRAAGGVILISTKRGKTGNLNVELTSYAGVQNITSGTPLMNTKEQMYVENQMLSAIGQEPLIFVFNPDALDFNSDFVGDIQNNNAAIQSYNLSVSGGQENLTFHTSVNYFDQEGILVNSGFNRLSTRINGEYKRDRFRAFASIGLTNENTEQEPWGIYEYAIVQAPWQRGLSNLDPVGDNGVYIPTRNAIQYGWLARQLLNEDNRESQASNIALNLEYEILKGLKVQTNLGRNTWSYSRKFFQPQFLVYGRSGLEPAASNVDASLMEEFIFSKRDTWESILNYNKKFGKHSLGVTGVYSMEKYNYRDINLGVVGLLSNDTDVVGAGVTGIKPTGKETVQTLTGKMLRAQYNYDERYLLSASVRRDGSSNFSEDNRYGTFFGASAGWNVSEEQFFKNSDALDFISNLKLRASYGEVGNQSIAPYMFSPTIENGIDYPFGPEGNENLEIGAIQRQYANNDIRWETTVSRNLGLDMSLFDDRLQLSADVYENDKKDMLLNQRLSPSTGTWPTRAAWLYNNVVVNAGNMVNKGLELSLMYKHISENGLKWNVNGTFTRNRNMVTNLNGIEGFALSGGRPVVTRGDRTDYTTYLIEGYEAGAFFLVENQGVIKTEEQLTAYREIDANAQLGDMMYKDQNGDNVIDDLDRVYKGSGQSDFDIGLSFNLMYKGFDFFVQSYYSQGAMIYNGSKLYAYGVGRHKDQYYMWTPQNPDSDIPVVRQSQEHANTRARSDFFLEDGTYLRIRNLTLGYDFAHSIFKGKVNKMRLYLTAQNPFTFTEYEGYDPEVGGDGLYTRGVDAGNYPTTRRFLMGLQFKF
ncbi:SusC/RagA family TonB-linked outer membrane protein [Sediminitomix flava]|uniref:TonB-linked SusC/RagA family outer membrane protein n=1 Tax=Sediminitomix flava TaxID=379075 RepID=A0A315Z4L9_SEDFL|nr:TonB-dependent receptor [Sediminitomix flava]PWJ37968.1 TonB-linked SusC/RagA family outer membrane protein [Sediminitomix flava]